MLGRLSEYASRVSLRVRKDETERTPYHLCLMLSWLLALANRLEVDLSLEVRDRCVTGLPSTVPLTELQRMFASRHFAAKRESAGLCLMEKILGLSAAFGKYRSTHERPHFQDTIKRMAQAVEALCVVASILGVNLGIELESYFGDGCSTCHHISCDCGFRADKVV